MGLGVGAVNLRLVLNMTVDSNKPAPNSSSEAAAYRHSLRIKQQKFSQAPASEIKKLKSRARRQPRDLAGAGHW